MDRFDRLTEERRSLDRELKSYISREAKPLDLRFFAADTLEERSKILDELDVLYKPFEAKYTALGEAVAKEMNRPWWKLW